MGSSPRVAARHGEFLLPPSVPPRHRRTLAISHAAITPSVYVCLPHEEQEQATSVEVDSILFGFWTDKEVRRLSVKRLTRSERLDAKNCLVPGGLLYPAMGPVNANDT